ncbi:hypothetical protein [Xanthomonas euvesicatoria]|uniref:hypothetical protein n=1 Tax=Xanthomonas euvesicatoria TaxID=456327 RepID=UPI001E45EE0B|nr:hypothetical protein [Xanthomonas euvesicatoria]
MSRQRKVRRRNVQDMRGHLRDAVEAGEIHHLHIGQIAQRDALRLPDGGVAQQAAQQQHCRLGRRRRRRGHGATVAMAATHVVWNLLPSL